MITHGRPIQSCTAAGTLDEALSPRHRGQAFRQPIKGFSQRVRAAKIRPAAVSNAPLGALSESDKKLPSAPGFVIIRGANF
jgi:hypothetical protein